MARPQRDPRLQGFPLRSSADLHQLLGRGAPPQAPSDRRLGELLVEEGLLSPQQLEAALALQRRQRRRHLGQILVEQGWVSQEAVALCLARKLGIPTVRLTGFEMPSHLLSLVPADLAVQYSLVPLGEVGGKLVVAMDNPFNREAVEALRFSTRQPVEVVMASTRDIQHLLQKFYSKLEEDEAMEALQLDPVGTPVEQESLHLMEQEAQRKPIVRLLNAILVQGVSRGASDINIRPERDRVNVYYRIDGKLHFARALHKSLLPALVSRVKITAQMDIAERRLPQDGHARLVWGRKSVDLRISVVPTVKGESVVIRVLDREAGLRPLDRLGLREEELAEIRRLMAKPHGLFLVTGPTGSGKSTTLYALLNELRRRDPHILTVEDPVEYDMEGIEQVQISPAKGLGFAQVLRHFLRHDPDVIMVGEIRDEETAEIANKAALTGHLVLSTLHTNDAVSTVSRLLDMGIEPYLLASTLLGVMAQRLVRLNCVHCLEREEVDPAIRRELGLGPEEAFYRGRGCELCGKIGYQGRTTVCELLTVGPELSQLIAEGAPKHRLLEAAREQGMVSLAENAVALARSGRTSVEEIYSVLSDL